MSGGKVFAAMNREPTTRLPTTDGGKGEAAYQRALDVTFSAVVTAAAVILAIALPVSVYAGHRMVADSVEETSNIINTKLELGYLSERDSKRSTGATPHMHYQALLSILTAGCACGIPPPTTAHLDYSPTCVFDDIRHRGYDDGDSLHRFAAKATWAVHANRVDGADKVYGGGGGECHVVECKRPMVHYDVDGICPPSDSWCRNPGIYACRPQDIIMLLEGLRHFGGKSTIESNEPTRNEWVAPLSNYLVRRDLMSSETSNAPCVHALWSEKGGWSAIYNPVCVRETIYALYVNM